MSKGAINSRSHSSMMKIRNGGNKASLISKRSSAATAMNSVAHMPGLIPRNTNNYSSNDDHFLNTT